MRKDTDLFIPGKFDDALDDKDIYMGITQLLVILGTTYYI